MDKINLDVLSSGYHSLYQYVQRHDRPQDRDRSFYFIRRSLPELCILQGKLRQIEESDKKQMDKSKIQEFDQLNSKVEKLANRIKEICSGYSDSEVENLQVEVADIDFPDLRGPLPENEHQKHLNWMSNKIDYLQKEVDKLDLSSLDTFMQNSELVSNQIKELKDFLNIERREVREERILHRGIENKIRLLINKLNIVEEKLITEKLQLKLNEYKKQLDDYLENRIKHPSYRSSTYRETFNEKRIELQKECEKISQNFSHDPNIQLFVNTIQDQSLKLSQEFQKAVPVYDRLDRFESLIQSYEERMRELILERYSPVQNNQTLMEKIKNEMINLNSLQDEIVDFLPLCKENKIRNEELVRLHQDIDEIFKSYKVIIDEIGMQLVIPTRYHSIEETVISCWNLNPEEMSEELFNKILELSKQVTNQIDYLTILYPNGSELLSNWKILKEKITLILDRREASQLQKQIRLFEIFIRSNRDSKQFVDAIYEYNIIFTSLFDTLYSNLKKYQYRYGEIEDKINELRIDLEQDKEVFIACMIDCVKISLQNLKKEINEPDMKPEDSFTKLNKIKNLVDVYGTEIAKSSIEDLKTVTQDLQKIEQELGKKATL